MKEAYRSCSAMDRFRSDPVPMRERRQVVPCRAGVLSAVVYSNGDVAVCETHPPLGNLRQRSFQEIWRAAEGFGLSPVMGATRCIRSSQRALTWAV